MIHCNNKCPLDKFSGCCHSCPDFEGCRESCEETAPECGEATFDEETGLQVFQQNQLEALNKIAAVIRLKKQAEEQEKNLKAALFRAMENYGIKKFESDVLNLTFVAPTTSTGVDSAKLKKKYPDIFSECSKTTTKAGYVLAKLKEQDGEK